MSNPERLRVAFQGELGAHSEDAIQLLFGAAAEPIPFAAHRDAVAALLDGRADRLVLPIENTIIGSMSETHIVLDATNALHAVGETVVEEHHCLIAPAGASLDSIATVLSHSVALAQCQRFFRKYPRMQTHGMFDTAGAAREVAQLGDPSFAAVAGRAAAGRYNLTVLAADIEDRHDNQTRFLAFARERICPEPATPARTLVTFTTNDSPGSLLIALQPFATHGVNLRRIDTWPTGEPWCYRFFVELDHEVGSDSVDAALDDVGRATAAMRIVGTFPRWKAGRRGSIGWTPTDLPVIE